MFEPTADAILWVTNTLLEARRAYEIHRDIEVMERAIRSKFWKKQDPFDGESFRRHLTVKPTMDETGELNFDFYPNSAYGQKLVIGMVKLGQQAAA